MVLQEGEHQLAFVCLDHLEVGLPGVAELRRLAAQYLIAGRCESFDGATERRLEPHVIGALPQFAGGWVRLLGFILDPFGECARVLAQRYLKRHVVGVAPELAV
jgi:hypothetical protein